MVRDRPAIPDPSFSDFVQRILKNIKLKTHPVVLGLTKFDKLYDVTNNQTFKSSRLNITQKSDQTKSDQTDHPRFVNKLIHFWALSFISSLDVSNVSNTINETTDQSPSSSSEDETVAEIRRFFKKHEIVKKLPKHMKELFIVETSADRNINISETFKEQFQKFFQSFDSPKNSEFPKYTI